VNPDGTAVTVLRPSSTNIAMTMTSVPTAPAGAANDGDAVVVATTVPRDRRDGAAMVPHPVR